MSEKRLTMRELIEICQRKAKAPLRFLRQSTEDQQTASEEARQGKLLEIQKQEEKNEKQRGRRRQERLEKQQLVVEERRTVEQKQHSLFSDTN